jgi:hypothetical protein
MSEKHLKIIYTPEEYSEVFENGRQKEALIVALDTRKFEIELYWKRTTYFWAFIASTFAAYFLLLTSNKIDQIKGITIVVAAIGFFFSLGWYFVNRGSKYWQKNWERHVAFLESEIQGPLFSYVKIPEDKFWNIKGEYPFSVSKINQLLSLMMVVFWFGIFIFSIFFSFNKLYYFKDIGLLWFSGIAMALIALLLILAWKFKTWSHSFLNNDEYRLKGNDKGNFIHT